MPVDIERAFSALGPMTSSRLEGLEDRVLASISSRRQSAMAARVTLTLASSALVMGVLGAAFPANRVSAAPAAPFGAASALTPSSLLLGPSG